MNAKKNNDLPDDSQFDDTFDEHNNDFSEDLGDLQDTQFEDYDLNDAETEPSGDVPTINDIDAVTDELNSDDTDGLPDTSASAKKGMGDLIRENWLFIAIGIVVISVAGYMIYGVLTPSAPAPTPTQQTQGNFGLPQQQAPSTQQTTTTTTTEQSAPQNPVSNNAMPMSSASPSIVMSEADMKTLMQGFQQMVQQNSQNLQQSMQTIINNTSQANTNEAAINNMQQEFATLGKEIKNYDNNMSALNKRLDTLQAQLTALVAQQTAQQEKLTLRAVVPGRAWLIDGKGRTISVT